MGSMGNCFKTSMRVTGADSVSGAPTHGGAAAQQPDRVGPRCLSVLLARARERYGTITPCAGKSWEECFMDHGKYGRFLYFNDSTGSTHIVKEEP